MFSVSARRTRTLQVLLLLVMASSEVRSQGMPEEEAIKKLRTSLGVSLADSLVLVRDSSPGLFPGVLFIQANWDNHGAQSYLRRAAVVSVDDQWALVEKPADVASLTGLGGPFAEPQRFRVLDAWVGLLRQTLLISPAARVIRSPAEIGLDQQKRLVPQMAVNQVRPPKVNTDSERSEVSFFVYDSGELLMIHCRAGKNSPLRVDIKRIARPILPGL
jgi:hypothetical protein